MKSTFIITGMRCAGCTQRVSQAIGAIPGVTAVHVALPNKAVIDGVRAISRRELVAALAPLGEYTIREGSVSFTDRVRPFAPLGAMFALVVVWSFVATHFWGHPSHWYHDWMRFFMAGFFFLFGGLKVFNLMNFAAMYRTYDIIAQRAPWWGYVYPFVEIELALLYAFDLFPTSANVATAVLMTVGAIGIARKLRSGVGTTCACLGGFFAVPLTWVTVAENMLMAAMAVWMLFFP